MLYVMSKQQRGRLENLSGSDSSACAASIVYRQTHADPDVCVQCAVSRPSSTFLYVHLPVSSLFYSLFRCFVFRHVEVRRYGGKAAAQHVIICMCAARTGKVYL